ncbi:MAG: cytochrome c5 family protein [Gammaproteobacteria bacterium]|nr:MAG: cytochrome c5 family protein [Gammaproteobacteria bacterium]UCH39440.1 MAG: cytochrome c5 family protein [Gammaproteobacteria bacterium]
MSDTQHDTFSNRNITVLGILLLIAVFIGEVLIGPHSDEEVVVEVADTMEDIAMRIKPVVSIEDIRKNMSVASAAADAADKSPDQLYQSACLACHTTGAAGAPKIGDAGAWDQRLAKGLDALVTSAINGIGAMPPRGGSQFNDDQIKAVVEYILDESR